MVAGRGASTSAAPQASNRKSRRRGAGPRRPSVCSALARAQAAPCPRGLHVVPPPPSSPGECTNVPPLLGVLTRHLAGRAPPLCPRGFFYLSMFAGRPARSELVFTTKESSYEDHTKSVHTNEIRRTMKQHRSVSQYTIELTSGHRRATRPPRRRWRSRSQR